ncbi:hypothetical protein PH7735_00357 [Shimia thalassica]|uniref:Uncharacterized protein n=1 Tax=Shimia thalassica TaxID=1715693 RepID=A0A0P1I193_9RHOB|nr:hypothetical protein [Shimia thalassica]CUJ84262.1 hypothetical protein PH7735_00357 [Shimia thalassica]
MTPRLSDVPDAVFETIDDTPIAPFIEQLKRCRALHHDYKFLGPCGKIFEPFPHELKAYTADFFAARRFIEAMPSEAFRKTAHGGAFLAEFAHLISPDIEHVSAAAALLELGHKLTERTAFVEVSISKKWMFELKTARLRAKLEG